MLDPERIPLGKLRQAYELNDQDERDLLSTLLPNGVFPLELWKKAYISLWNEEIFLYMRKYNLNSSSFPRKFTCIEFSERDIQLKLYQDIMNCHGIIHNILGEASAFLLPYKIKRGVKLILGEVYDTIDTVYKRDIDDLRVDTAYSRDINNLCDTLTTEHNKFTVRFESNTNVKQFVETIYDKISAISWVCKPFVSKYFFDTIVVDKFSAIRHLHDCGYPLLHEVKSLSRTLVGRITAEGSAPQAQDDAQKAPSEQGIPVPRSLWEGKIAKSVRDNMRQKDFEDSVIAHVLHDWCGLKNKTQIGRLLGPANQNDRTYSRLAERLLAEAEALNIRST